MNTRIKASEGEKVTKLFPWEGATPLPKSDEFQRIRHARYIEDHVLYHVVFRTQQSKFLLRPDTNGRLEDISLGVLGRSHKRHPSMKCYAIAMLSNHVHMLVSGKKDEFSDYVGFFKREISRRWGPHVNWRGIFERGFVATAVLTKEGQHRALRYVLSQGAKEGLVDDSREWPGLHCARLLSSITRQTTGHWFDGTAYGHAKQQAKRRKLPTTVDRKQYYKRYTFTLAKLPALEYLGDEEYRDTMCRWLADIRDEAEQLRGRTPPLGTEAICSADPEERSPIPPTPWYRNRRHMIIWDNLNALSVRAYIDRYWRFQSEFRVAADDWATGNLAAQFPVGSWRPGIARPVMVA